MALPHHHLLHDEPVSRTHQYRKVMKPLLERKRRARINRCLDELKELMVTALATDGDNVSKLEKADILELTVRHLHGLRGQQGRPDRFVAGFAQCAREVTLFVGEPAGRGLLQHLGACARRLDGVAAEAPAPVWRPW